MINYFFQYVQTVNNKRMVNSIDVILFCSNVENEIQFSVLNYFYLISLLQLHISFYLLDLETFIMLHQGM